MAEPNQDAAPNIADPNQDAANQADPNQDAEAEQNPDAAALFQLFRNVMSTLLIEQRNAMRDLLDNHPSLRTPTTVGVYARTPARAVSTGINYATREGISIYRGNTEPLATTFSIKRPQVITLLNQVRARAEKCGWTTLFVIPQAYIPGTTADKNLLDEYGLMTTSNVLNYGATYIHTDTRHSQNDMQLYECLFASMDKQTIDHFAKLSKDYKHADPTTRALEPCGIAFLHAIITKSMTTARATAASIRASYAALPTYMVEEAKGDVIAFNERLTNLMAEMRGVGGESTDLINHYFAALKMVPDTDFRRTIDNLHDKYDEGEDITVESLITKTTQQQKLLVTRGTWLNKSVVEEEVLALRAELKQVKEQKVQKRSNSSAKSNKKSGKNDSDKKDGKKDGKKKKKKVFDGDEEWKNHAPTDGNLIKTFKGREYKYCEHHGWRGHTTHECEVLKKKKKRAEQQNNQSQSGANDSNDDEATRFVSSMAAIGIHDVAMEDSDEE